MDCPYCSAEKSAFISQSDYPHPLEKNTFWMFFKCPACHGGIAVSGVSKPRDVLGSTRTPQECDGDIHDYFERIKVFPRKTPVSCPTGIPEGIARLYIRAEEAIRRGDTDSASILIRKALEGALKLKFNAIEGSLCHRIEELKITHKLTSELAAWAHEIRLDGNQAAHDLTKPGFEETKELKQFLHVFLLHTFTLPAMIAARKQPPA
jgi:hypothetical protein